MLHNILKSLSMTMIYVLLLLFTTLIKNKGKRISLPVRLHNYYIIINSPKNSLSWIILERVR